MKKGSSRNDTTIFHFEMFSKIVSMNTAQYVHCAQPLNVCVCVCIPFPLCLFLSSTLLLKWCGDTGVLCMCQWPIFAVDYAVSFYVVDPITAFQIESVMQLYVRQPL